MSSSVSVPAPANPIIFDRARKFLSDSSSLGIEIAGSGDADVLLALARDEPFPERRIELGEVSLSAEAGRDIEFQSSRGVVSFRAGAQTSEGLAVYQNPRDLVKALESPLSADSLASSLKIEEDGAGHYVLLRWDYDAKAVAKGAVALGGGIGSIKFGVEAGREALFAVIRRFPKTTGARTAVTDTVNSWMLPGQVRSIADLKPGTWLISEVDGSIAANLGVQFGYDFNWVREARMRGLTGDIGLRIQLGVAATVGFSASGKYAIIVSRESLKKADRALRLRISRLSKKGWNFAFNASTTVKADFSQFLPDEADDFIAAVFGVYGPQVVRDLQAFEEWNGKAENLPGALSGLSLDYGLKLLKEITRLDPEREFEAARTRLRDLHERWNSLPHQTATNLWKIVDSRIPDHLKSVRELARAISQADERELSELLGTELRKVDFFRSPAGQWLESAAVSSVLTALAGAGGLQQLKDAASNTAGILDGGEVEETLKNIQQVVNQHLNLDELRKVVDEASFKEISKLEWLTKKLEDFLDDRLDLKRTREVQDTIQFLLDKRRDFYEKARKALSDKYDFEFSATYQKTATGSALLDVTFDFSQGPDELAILLEKALDGNFDTLFVTSARGVSLNAATLSHGISRQSAVEISLPFYDRKVRNINQSLTKVAATDDGGRVLIYELDAADVVASVSRGKSARESQLAVGARLATSPDTHVRVFSTESLSCRYSLRQATKGMKTAELQSQFKPYTLAYFPDTFHPTQSGATFDDWVADLDKAADQIADNGTGNFGDTLISLDLSLPGKVAEAWLKAPAKKSPEHSLYMDMSRRLQAALKNLIPFYYFQDLKKYDDLVPAAALLVYAAIPPSTSVRLQGSKLTFNTDREVYWNWPDRIQREAMASSSATVADLAARTTRIHEVLTAVGHDRTAGFYRPGENTRSRLVADALRDGHGETLLRSLLFIESRVVRGAYEAGLKMSEFRRKAKGQPSEAMIALAEFGAQLTGAFNKNFRSVYGAGALRPLGTMVFAEAALALDPGLADTKPKAMLALTVLKPDAGFQLESFLNNQLPAETDVLLEERIVNV
jgi:DNA-binding ferritin-like protein (Dps family)